MRRRLSVFKRQPDILPAGESVVWNWPKKPANSICRYGTRAKTMYTRNRCSMGSELNAAAAPRRHLARSLTFLVAAHRAVLRGGYVEQFARTFVVGGQSADGEVGAAIYHELDDFIFPMP